MNAKISREQRITISLDEEIMKKFRFIQAEEIMSQNQYISISKVINGYLRQKLVTN